jgi:hypothetical protein
VTTYQTPIIAGVFVDAEHAKTAFDTLRGANFKEDQVGVALPGTSNVEEGLAKKFIDLGVPQDRAKYYESEFNAGHIVVSVRPDEREKDARDILHASGGYDFGENPSQPASQTQTQPGQGSQGQPVNEAATEDYSQQDYHKDLP